MYYLVLILATAALAGGANVNRHLKLLAEIDNHIESNAVAAPSSKRFITLTRRPAARNAHRPGTTLELTCEAIAAPAPSVHWFKNDAPVYEVRTPKRFITLTSKRFITLTRWPAARNAHRPGTTLELTCEAIAAPAPSVHWFKNDAPVYEYDKESNEIIDSNPSSLARVSSTLLVSRTDGPAQYTCLVVAGQGTARASTIVYSTDGSTDTSERSKLVPLSPRILVSYKVFVDTIGNNVVLPCRVRGHPRPNVTWQTNGGLDVTNEPRMKVLRSGELVISPLLWSDMGEFTCRASNLFGSTEVKTFVYPARQSDTDG
ncbi:neural/ectodermal development factor IMP-L2-like isoform X3 [Maniola hyperantus]|uniref:neural/ectodermal development factor IMP-L2-like isoform X3 n=1 Tax=Aphantopus hyperantus TaxID=2795564 RepID=UPI003749DFD8